jgi:hypothetical protein
MSNLTISVEAETWQRARERAMAEGRSVNAILREYLERYSGTRREQRDALSDLLSVAAGCPSRSGGADGRVMSCTSAIDAGIRGYECFCVFVRQGRATEKPKGARTATAA